QELLLAAIGLAKSGLRGDAVGDVCARADEALEVAGRGEARTSPRLEPTPVPVATLDSDGCMERPPIAHASGELGGVGIGVVRVHQRLPASAFHLLGRDAEEVAERLIDQLLVAVRVVHPYDQRQAVDQLPEL